MLNMLKKLLKRSSFVRNSFPLQRFMSRWHSRLNYVKDCVRGMIVYHNNKHKYNLLNTDCSFDIHNNNNFPIYTDRYSKAGTLGNYFWQDLWAAKLIFKNNPKFHYDIGSRVDGFIGHLASFRKNVYLIDIRPLENVIPGVSFVQADATDLAGISDSSIESISALCSIEHFGLGRYGDEVDPDAWKKVISSIKRVLQPNGHVYLSVPIGHQHVEFDAHRIFYASSIVKEFSPLKLLEFSCCYDKDNNIEKDAPLNKYDNDFEKSCVRFGLFHFIK